MIYAIADIHGHYDKYISMLEKIKFSDDDVMFVLGDVIDRGPHGMKILKDMMMRSNVYPIMGNHEYMAKNSIPWLMQEITEETINCIEPEMLRGLLEWMNVGGDASISEFRNMSREEQESISDYLSEFELYDIVKAGGKKFLLVHAGLQNFSRERDLDDYSPAELLFFRPDYDAVYFEDMFLVTGHTPTRTVYAAEKGVSPEDMTPSEYQDVIFKKNNHIAIDCGLGFDGRLGCICLDTLEEFYV